MVTKKHTVSIRLTTDAARRLEKAASLTRQSPGAFLEKAGDETAHRILLEWAGAQYRQGLKSFSQLADETGLAIEEIMLRIGSHEREQALDAFLASCRTVAEARGNPDFLRVAKEVGKTLAEEIAR
jgi:uncharacterized protein (DUF1778 family)